MYSIGDKIVYPMHGAGIIEAIEEDVILGQKQSYYVLRIPVGDIKVMIPLKKADEIGIRKIISSKEADALLKELPNLTLTSDNNWNKRYRDNMNKIRTGDIYEVARVVKCLVARDEERSLSTCERKMLANAKQILISEISLSKNMSAELTEKSINESIHK